MAKYTIQLRNVANIYGEDEVKSWFTDYELSDYLTADKISTISSAGLWTKEKLANLIYDEYYMSEIGFETPYLFKQRTKAKMRKIMDKYLPLIYTISLDYSPIKTLEEVETYTGVGTKKDNGTSSINTTNGTTVNSSSGVTATNSGLTVNSDTPQGEISKTEILAGKYASNTSAAETSTQTNDTSTSTSNATGTNTGTTSNNQDTTNNYTRTKTGSIDKDYSDLIYKYRKNIANINEQIIEDLSILFMGIM